MSRPRKPFGANHPGRLPATMMKVLAAEMSDPARLRRGKQYAKNGSVVDIIIERGTVTGEIQGTRSTPYIASIQVTSGDGMPLRRDITTSCSCPDDDNWDGDACKHVVATMFVLSDEFLLEPELLDVWRDRNTATVDDDDDDDDADADADADDDDDDDDDDATDDDPIEASEPGRRRGGRHLRLVTDGERRAASPRHEATPPDRLADLLSVPEGTDLAEIPELDRVEADLPRDRQLAEILHDAIGHLRIDWD